VYIAGCQTGCTTRFDNRVERTVCSFNTVVKPVVQPVVSCKRGITVLLDRLHVGEIDAAARLRNVNEHSAYGVRNDGRASVDVHVGGSGTVHARLGVHVAVRVGGTRVDDHVLGVHVEHLQ